MNTKIGGVAIALAVLFLAYPQISAAETTAQDVFKASEFLTWEREGQSLYIGTAVGMAALIVNKTSVQQADCIEAWFNVDKQNDYSETLEAMQKFKTYHPRGILLALMEKKCGSFTYKAE